jgi:hypothetical protein
MMESENKSDPSRSGGTPSKSGKRRTTIRRAPAPSTEQAPTVPVAHQPDSGGSENGGRDPETVSRIRERAYALFQSCGCQDGHDLEHWLEAERQVIESENRRSA